MIHLFRNSVACRYVCLRTFSLSTYLTEIPLLLWRYLMFTLRAGTCTCNLTSVELRANNGINKGRYIASFKPILKGIWSYLIYISTCNIKVHPLFVTIFISKNYCVILGKTQGACLQEILYFIFGQYMEIRWYLVKQLYRKTKNNNNNYATFPNTWKWRRECIVYSCAFYFLAWIDQYHFQMYCLRSIVERIQLDR